MQYWLRILLALLLLLLIGYHACILPLSEGHYAIITHFGNPHRVIKEPGPHFMWPWPIDKHYVFDARSRVHQTRLTQTLTRDKKSIILLTYLVWNIENPLEFLGSAGNEQRARQGIEGIVSSAKTNVMGGYNLSNLVSTDPEELKINEIENRILRIVRERAKNNYGINVSKLGIKRLSYPESNTREIFAQMRAERGQFAANYRAEGRKQASIILSETDLEIAQIESKAAEEAARIRGEAERDAAEIYAKTYAQSRDFYQFSRSLQVLENMINQNTTFILRSDQPPFHLLTDDYSINLKNQNGDD